MARVIGKLTALAVTRAKRRGYLSDGGGLFLAITATGSKSWVFRFRVGGRLREMGLGPLHTVSLAEAREKALTCRKLRLDAKDPIETRRNERIAARLEAARGMTFGECAQAYVAAHKSAWHNAKHAKDVPASLAAYATPVLGGLPVQAIDTALVVRVLEPIWQTRTETASRVRARIEAILDWARVRGYRDGENPARWRGHLENLLPKKSKVRRVAHHIALPYAEIGEFMSELRQQQGTAARALEFTVLSAARSGEVIGSRWSEFDLEARLWVISGERMKAGKEHRVPLSDAAVAILRQMAAVRQGEFVFSGLRAGKPIGHSGMIKTLRRMGRDSLTAHGFRSSFRTWAAEQTRYPREVIELSLAHAIGSAVEAAYHRSDLIDMRRQLADAWARYCEGPAAYATVTALRRQR
jgi:integrase